MIGGMGEISEVTKAVKELAVVVGAHDSSAMARHTEIMTKLRAIEPEGA